MSVLISVSSSVKDGKTLITIGNLSCHKEAEFCLEGVGMDIPASATLQLLADEDLHAHNTFDEPEAVMPVSKELDLTQPVRIPKGGIAAIRF